MLLKIENGVEVKMTPEEEQALSETWCGDKTPINAKKIIEEINRIAFQKISSIAPLYMQNNMLAEAIEVIYNNGPQETIDKIQAVWAKIKTVRIHSNNLINAVKANQDVNIYDNWPNE